MRLLAISWQPACVTQSQARVAGGYKGQEEPKVLQEGLKDRERQELELL